LSASLLKTTDQLMPSLRAARNVDEPLNLPPCHFVYLPRCSSTGRTYQPQP
jgi:hypothetical protein